jgi:putative ABC transport system ATP-binding protein
MRSSARFLDVRGIGRRQPGGTGWLLREIWCEVHPGDRLAIVGPSGAGKTLLLRALALLDPLDAGVIHWDGQPIPCTAIPSYRRQVAYLHQRPVLFEGSVEANLRQPFALEAHRGSRFDRGRIMDLLAELGRDASFLTRSHGDLSGGEAQLVALIRTLQLDPAVLLLDEPTASLDGGTARAVEQLLERWIGEAATGRALLWISHDLGQARRVSDRTLCMRDGRLEPGGSDGPALS